MRKQASALGKSLYEMTRGLEGADAETAAKRFLELLAERHQLDLLPDIIRAYETAAKEGAGVETIGVVTATAPSERSARELTGILEKAAGAPVEIEWRTDPSLIGGAVIRHEDALLDASVKTKLKRLREHLTSDI